MRGLLSGDHSNIEHVGPGLFAKIESLPDNCEIKVISGDVSPPIGGLTSPDITLISQLSGSDSILAKSPGPTCSIFE